MNIRGALPSLASIFAFALLGVSTLFLLESLDKPQKKVAPSPEIISAAPSENDARPPNELSMQVDIHAIISRPLLSPSRKVPEFDGKPESLEEPPEAPTPEVVVHLPLTPPKIAMIGILEEDGRLMALIRARDGTEQWVKHGSEIEGWRVVNITPQSITLQLNGESADIYTVE